MIETDQKAFEQIKHLSLSIGGQKPMKIIWARIGQPITLPCELESRGSEEANASESRGSEEANASESRGSEEANASESRESEANASDQLEWRKNGSLIFNAFGAEPGFFASAYQGRLSRGSGMDLAIHSVQLQDQSTFLCSISRFPRGKTVGGREYGKFIRLIVHLMPRILEPLDGSKIIAKENSSVRQNCLADGIPTPNIKWSKKRKNGTWETVGFDRQLRIEHFSSDNEGNYNCEAKNLEGTQNAAVVLKMRKPLRIDRENPSLVNKTAVEGSAVFWQCSVEHQKLWAAVGKVRVQWTKGGKAINQLELGLRAHLDDGSFGIMHLRRTDLGEFECTATFLDSTATADGLLESDSVKMNLNVQYRPEISPKTRRFYTLAAGASADLHCLINANPKPTVVRWTKNGRELTSHAEKSVESNLLQSTVNIPSAHLRDSVGIYTCEAKNAVGVTEPPLEIHVVVAEAPKFTKIPAPKYFVKAGERVEIECEGFAEVPIRRVWSRKDDGKHLSFSDDKFVLSNAAHADHGLYCCVLISSVATTSRDVQLIVDETAPQCATKVRVQCEGRQRFAAHWVPGYSGRNHSQTFRIFYRKMREGLNDEAKEEWEVTALTDQPKIHLDRLELFGEYEFKLEASNRFGAINCTVPGTHYTCAKLDPPSNFFLGQATTFNMERVPILNWDKVKEANLYKIKYRKSCDGNKGNGLLQEIIQTSETNYKLPADKFNSTPKCCFEFVVQSIRVPFTGSDHSPAIIYPSSCADGILPSNSATVLLLSACGLLLLFLIVIFALIFCLQRFAQKIQPRHNRPNIGKSSKLRHNRLNHRKADSKNGEIGTQSEEKSCFEDSFNCSSSRFGSTSTAASVYAQCAFGHPIAITRKLFPENYICTKFARFDEEEEEEESDKSEEGFGHISSDDVAFLNAFNGFATNSGIINDRNDSVSGNNESDWQFADNLNNAERKTATYVEMNMADGEGEEKRSVVGEMLREKYLFAEAELNVLQELRIEQLRREINVKEFG
uniref:Ig-like domain-containing protein n=1 Tax=Globodera rostochiensis TaxID=31243 RepID=A0A914H2R7_GLORO